MYPVIEINNLIHMDPQNQNLIASLIKKTCVAILWSMPASIENRIIGNAVQSTIQFFFCQDIRDESDSSIFYRF